MSDRSAAAGEAATGPTEAPGGGDPGGEVDLVVVTMTFDATDDAALLAVLAKYVVMTRMEPGCRNVDLCSSVTVPGRHLVIQKWDDDATRRAHFDAAPMVEMAESCRGLLAHAPHIDLWEPTSAHDLR